MAIPGHPDGPPVASGARPAAAPTDGRASEQPLRIGIIGPIAWRTPPCHYGPWELFVSLLTEGLVARGVDVTLFATADSVTTPRLVSVAPCGYSEDPSLDARVYESMHVAAAFERAGDLALIHNSADFVPLTYTRLVTTPVVTTIHGFGSDATLPAYQAYANRVADVAERAGLPLVIAGIVQDAGYFRREVEPRIDGERVRYLGSVGPQERQEVLGGALLHLIDVDEPFGFSVVEAMACGTPVIAYPRGSMPELITPGADGLLVHTPEEAVTAVDAAADLDRMAVRRSAATRFSLDRMVDEYLALYHRLLGR